MNRNADTDTDTRRHQLPPLPKQRARTDSGVYSTRPEDLAPEEVTDVTDLPDGAVVEPDVSTECFSGDAAILREIYPAIRRMSHVGKLDLLADLVADLRLIAAGVEERHKAKLARFRAAREEWNAAHRAQQHLLRVISGINQVAQSVAEVCAARELEATTPTENL